MSTVAGRYDDRPGILVTLGVVGALCAVPLALFAAIDPIRALAVALGVGVVVFCVLRVDLAVLLLAAVAPLESAISISSNPSLTITKVAGAVCFASFALFAMTTRHRVVLDRSHAIVFLLLALALVSTIQAEEIPAALATTARYAAFVSLFVVVSQFLGDVTLQRRLAWTLSIASTLASAQAVYNFLGANETLVARPSYGDPNDLAFVLATTLPFTFWLLADRRGLRLLALAMIGMIAAGIVLSFSRGALVGLAAAGLWHFVTERRHVPVILAGALIAAAGVATLIQSSPSRFQVGLEAKEKVAEANIDTRLRAWGAATELAAENPLVGVGPGNFRYRYAQVADTVNPTNVPEVVHNAYLDIAAELGFVGLFLFLAYLTESFWRLSLAARRGYGLPGFAAAVRTSLIVACVSAVFLSEQYYAPFWLLGAIATGLWTAGMQAERAAAQRPRAGLA